MSKQNINHKPCKISPIVKAAYEIKPTAEDLHYINKQMEYIFVSSSYTTLCYKITSFVIIPPYYDIILYNVPMDIILIMMSYFEHGYLILSTNRNIHYQINVLLDINKTLNSYPLQAVLLSIIMDNINNEEKSNNIFISSFISSEYKN